MRISSGALCEVWWARPVTETAGLLQLLDEVERQRHETYQRPIDKARFLTGRVVAKAVAGAALGLPPAKVALDSTCPDCDRPHGKPVVVRPDGYPADAPLPQLSISHSGDRVALAVTAGPPVGVDVEQERDVAVNDLVRLALSDAELESFHQLPEPEREGVFFTYWSRKEALLKATGRGLSLPMTKVTLSPPGQPPRVLDAEVSEVDTEGVALADLDAGPGYRACVAVLTRSAPDGDWVTPHDAADLIAECRR